MAEVELDITGTSEVLSSPHDGVVDGELLAVEIAVGEEEAAAVAAAEHPPVDQGAGSGVPGGEIRDVPVGGRGGAGDVRVAGGSRDEPVIWSSATKALFAWRWAQQEEPEERGIVEGVESAEEGGVGGHAPPALAGESSAREGSRVREAEEDLA